MLQGMLVTRGACVRVSFRGDPVKGYWGSEERCRVFAMQGTVRKDKTMGFVVRVFQLQSVWTEDGLVGRSGCCVVLG